MSAQAEPKRLLEQPGSDLDVLLLESALDETPPARAVDRTLVALGVASAATSLCAGAASTAAVKTGAGGAGWFASLSIVSKLGMGVAFVAASVGVPYALLRQPAPAQQDAVAAEAGSPGRHGGAPAPAAPSPDSPRTESSPPGAAPVVDAPGRTEVEPSREASPAAPKAVDQKAATQPGSKAQAAGGSSGGGAGQKAAPAEQGGLADERKLLDAARSALRRGDKAASLAHLDAYAVRFPNGQLKPEAQSMRQAASQ